MIAEFRLIHLFIIHRFCDELSTALHEHREKMIVVCPEIQNTASLEVSSFLVGSYLVLMQGETAEAATNSVKNLACSVNLEYSSDFIDGLKALAHARELSWLGPDLDECTFDVEMSAHYAKPCNGNIHPLVPGRLLLFPAPEPLPRDQGWIDVPGMPAERRFSAHYLADLLAELDASVAVFLTECPPGDERALLARGLDVHGLRLDPHRPSTLRAMDLLLTLARAAAPGAVAVCAAGGPQLQELAGRLAAAFLVSDLGFDAAAAAAWLSMLCPALLPP